VRDTVVVWKLDRLGRNTLHILETVKELTDRGVTLVSTSDGIDSSTPAGRMMIGVLGSLAEYERELTIERTALKREASRANGTKFGRLEKSTMLSISRPQGVCEKTGTPPRRSLDTSGSAGRRCTATETKHARHSGFYRRVLWAIDVAVQPSCQSVT